MITQASSSRSMAISATLHCITGCSIGEIAGMIIATLGQLSNGASIGISVVLAFVFGYALSLWSLKRAKVPLKQAFGIVLLADSLSILTMELMDNSVIILIPDALNAHVINPLFWISMIISLTAAFIVTVPVNEFLIKHGKGHALIHKFH